MRNNIFEGTYGWDRFSKFIALMSVPFILSQNTKLLGVVIFLYAFWRRMSKNIEKRQREEIAFENWLRDINYRFSKIGRSNFAFKIRNNINKISSSISERRNFIITKCPNCGQKLRLPRGKGKILVTCKNCSCKFEKKS